MFFDDFWPRPPFGAVRRLPADTPVGAVVPYAGQLEAGSLKTQGWLCCDGSAVDKVAYPELYAVIGNVYGESGDQFNLPDYSGYFLRGLATEGPSTVGRKDAPKGAPNGVGSTQEDQFQEHEHTYPTMPILTTEGSSKAIAAATEGTTKKTSEGTTTKVVCSNSSSNGDSCYGAETRPKNVFVYFLIKARQDVRLLGVPAWPGGFRRWR